MSNNGSKIEIPGSIVVRDLAQKIGRSPIDLIKKLMSNGVMATINQSVDFDTAAIVVEEYGFEAIPEVIEDVVVETGEVPLWRQMIADEDQSKLKQRPPVVTILGHDPPDGCRRGRSRGDYPAYRCISDRNEGTHHYIPRYTRSRCLYSDACAWRSGCGYCHSGCRGG